MDRYEFLAFIASFLVGWGIHRCLCYFNYYVEIYPLAMMNLYFIILGLVVLSTVVRYLVKGEPNEEA